MRRIDIGNYVCSDQGEIFSIIIKVVEFLDAEVTPVLAKYAGQLEGTVALAV